MLVDRRARYDTASTLLASASDVELADLIDAGRAGGVGVGGDSVILSVGGVPVFAKRIPLTDQELARPHCTANLFDFGLATSPRFNLAGVERDFAERNATHDAGYASMVLVNSLVTAACGVPTPASGGPVARNEYVRQCAAGHIPDDLPPAVAGVLGRHAHAAATMNGFYWRLFGGEVRAEYPGL